MVKDINQILRALETLSGACTGLMMILVGSMIPSGLIMPGLDLKPTILSLPSTWQTSAVLICSIVCGPKPGIIAASAYITVGLFYFPVFHNGGSIDYITNPGFGYLIGFIPAAWICGRIIENIKKKDIINLIMASIAGLLIIQLCGSIFLIFGTIIDLWPSSFIQLFYNFSLAPFPAQLALCAASGILSLTLRELLLIE